jgi:hypothetical protein
MQFDRHEIDALTQSRIIPTHVGIVDIQHQRIAVHNHGQPIPTTSVPGYVDEVPVVVMRFYRNGIPFQKQTMGAGIDRDNGRLAHLSNFRYVEIGIGRRVPGSPVTSLETLVDRRSRVARRRSAEQCPGFL